MPFGIPNLYVYAGVGVIVAGLSVAVYVQQQRVDAARARVTVAERDRDQWKNNYTEAARVAKANEDAVAEIKTRLAESGAAADEAAKAAAAATDKYKALLAKVKEQHAPSDSSPLLRAYLDGLCVSETTAACSRYGN